MIIDRPTEAGIIAESGKWTFIYGRRKTGKTFLVDNFVKFDEYFFVKSSGSIMTKDNDSISYETFVEILRRSLGENKTVVVDEFHRLGQDFFDFLHFTKKSGKLIIISSTLFLSKKLISSKSPLLGLFREIPIGLISLRDTLKALGKAGMPKKEMLELAVLLQEPLAIDYFDAGQKPRETLAKVVLGSAKTIPALIGEIFSEEQREISGIYEGILRAIASGKVGSGEISSHLFSKKLIKKDDPSIIQQYLANLASFGIIKRIQIYNQKRFAYKLVSPIARIYYYADEKYNFSERKDAQQELAAIIDELIPRIIEDAVRQAIAEKNGLTETILESGDFEVDGILLKFKKPEIALEVKWKNPEIKEIVQMEAKLGKTEAKTKIIFVPDKNKIKTRAMAMDPEDLLK